jgi:hypothetical protein
MPPRLRPRPPAGRRRRRSRRPPPPPRPSARTVASPPRPIRGTPAPTGDLRLRAPALVRRRALAAELHLAGPVLVLVHGGRGVHGPTRQRGLGGAAVRRLTAVAAAGVTRERVDHRGGRVHGLARQRGQVRQHRVAPRLAAVAFVGEQVDAERGELGLVLLDEDEVDGAHGATQLLGAHDRWIAAVRAWATA